MPMVGEEGQGVTNGRCEERGVGSLFSSSFTTYPITVKFTDICYRIKLQEKMGPNSSGSIKRLLGGRKPDQMMMEERTILNGITGLVSPGEILAILGPSGSGKSTLLNVLAGRLQGSYTGTVLANGRTMTKPILRRSGFVTQDDILYPHLTVKETLVFCSLLRLPKTLSNKEKVRVAESVISELGLGKCENTIIGNTFVRGVSGGERKRVCIGHEMLVDPSLLILDEPTSGLDSTAAYRLVSTLGTLAKKGKTLVTSMHQPSSRVYQMFDSVLLLSEGRCLYFGKGSDAMDYFASVGFVPSFPMNPADFMLDLANGVAQVESQGDTEKPNNIKQALVVSYNSLLAPKVKAFIDADTYRLPKGSLRSSEEDKRSNGWFTQFTILLHRSLKERRHEAFNSLRVFQVVAAAVLAGSMWWHSDMRNVHDRLGLLFFISIFWGVFPSFNAVFTFPQERAIFMKERSSGMYTLSSYFMARLAGDLPMELILPTAFITICYWMAGLRPDVGSFLLTLLVLLGYVLVAQGLGLALGAAIMDAKQASTMATIAMLAFLLTGGFYVQKVPACMTWLKYTSFTFYCYKLLIQVQYGVGEATALLGCAHHGKGSKVACGFIEEDISPMVSVAALVIMFVGYRLLAYAALRRMKV
ncbi:ABC transporter G family member 25 [Magnolia sinica]|uniref:ABC transporter G family member 25 n=1 Tax=Magnolia sinica TaxID=86752 RepID=UPI002659F59E|nr:ABC transporter G family member 25 [Magnolia sinica]